MANTRMRPITDTITLEAARAIVQGAIRPIERRERVVLSRACGRVIAEDVRATRDVPPFPRAGMDGFAVRAADTAGASRHDPRALRVIAKVHTAQVSSEDVSAGTCVEIATGAPMPDGADAVVMVEETESIGDDEVLVFTPVTPGQNVGRQGADIARGQVVLRAGEVLNPSRIGALAALGVQEADVYARPEVAIVSTGNEIVEPGQELAHGEIYDINRFTLAAVVDEHGGDPRPRRAARDTIEDLEEVMNSCLAHDLVIFSGGSSAGERDLVFDVIKQRGELLFHGIAVKPGKPTAFGVIDRKPVFGMPGYPTSCLTIAYVLVVPALRRIARLPPLRPRTVELPLSRRIESATGRHQFYTVSIADGEAVPAFKASGDITSMSHADGYIEIPAHKAILEKGEMVEVVLF